MADNRYIKNQMIFTVVTNPFKLVDNPYSFSGYKVYDDRYEPLTEAVQNTFLVKECKQGSVLRVRTAGVKYPKDCDFKSVMHIFERYRMFPLVECGKSSMRKDLVTVDIDESLDVKDMFMVLKGIKNLPECLITRHVSTGHWQIQFYLKNGMYTKGIDFSQKSAKNKRIPKIVDNENVSRDYSVCVKRFSRFFKHYFRFTDSCYNGTLCRNPFSFTQKSYVVKNGVLHHLKDRKPSGVLWSDLTDFLDENHIILRKNTNFEIKEIEEKNINYSRHNLTMVYAREWMWHNMRNGDVPDENALEEYLLSVKYEIAEKCFKNPHSDKEIKSQVKSLYRWSVRNYREIQGDGKQWKSSVIWNKNQRANKIKKAKKLKNQFISFVCAGYSLKEIADIFGMSRTTLYTYMAVFFVMDTVKTVRWFKDNDVKFGGYVLWTDIITEISDKIKLLKLKFGDSRIRWKRLDYEQVAEDYEHTVNYDIPLEGNFELETA